MMFFSLNYAKFRKFRSKSNGKVRFGFFRPEYSVGGPLISVRPIEPKFAVQFLTNRFTALLLFTSVKNSEKEQKLAGLQYIGGYVLHKIHTKHASKSSESEQAISILKAGKLEGQNAIECQKLTSSLNRGGLWATTKNAQSIFERTEHYFRDTTSNTTVQNIAFASIISRSVHDVEVVSAYNSLLSNAELIINSSVAKDVLHNIIQLYVKVRSFLLRKILSRSIRLD